MDKIDFKVMGKIVGKQRPRATSYGGRAHIYTPKETMNYESLVRFSFLEKYPNHIPYSNESALKVHLTAFKTIPKAFSKKKRQLALDGMIRPKTKPDLDNIAKSVLDGLNQVAFVDDKCVVDLHIEQYYHQVEFVLVEIEEIKNV
jgi:Holliday junction resolvase RusA-like endonuclease